MKVCLILLIVLPFIIQAYYEPIPAFKTYRAVLWTIPNNTPKTNISDYYNFTYNWDNVNTNIVNSQIVWGGYRINTINKWISFDLHLDYPTATSVMIGYNVHKDSEILYAIFYILLLHSSPNLVQMNYKQHFSSLLNQSTATRAASDETITFTSDKFYFSSKEKYLVNVFIRSFDVRNIESTGAQDLQISFVDLILNTNQFMVKFCSDFTKKTRFFWIRIATIIVYIPSFKSKLIYYSNIISMSSGSSNFTTNFGASGVFSPSFYSSCVVGLTSFTHISLTSRPVEIGYVSSGTVSVSISSLLQANHSALVFNVLCLLQCDFYHFAYGDYCWPCSTAIPGCYSCYSMSVCASCYPEFIHVGGNCVCPSGYRSVTGHCTNMAGCITVVYKVNTTTTQCSACDITKRFKLINNTCVCEIGYYLSSSSETCLEICGDGILFSDQCDDGNTNNGDGCSSTCKVESKYICYNGTSNHVSECVYKGKQLKLALVYADKVPEMNRAIFVFRIYPSIDNLRKLNFQIAGNFTCQQNIHLISSKYENRKLQILIDYEQDLQGNPATYQITFDPKIIDQTPIGANISMVSRGCKLIVMRQYNNILTANIFINVIGGLIVLVYFVGSLTHKMIGVETLQCFQVIFLFHFLNTNFTDGFFQFKFLFMVVANFGSFSNNSASIVHPRDAFTFSVENKELSSMVILSLTVASCVSFLLIKMAESKQLISSNKWSRYLFNHALFPSFVGFCLVNILNRAMKLNGQPIFLLSNVPIMASVFFQIFLLVSTSLICFHQWKIYLLRKLKECSNKHSIGELSQCKFAYVPIYLTFFLCFSLAIFAEYLQFSSSRYILLSIAFTYALWIIIYQPYDKNIHNAAQIMNALLIFFFLVWSIARVKVTSLQEQHTQILIVFVFLILMGVCLLLSMIRIGYQLISRFCSNTQKSQQNRNDMDLEHQNLATIVSNKLKEKDNQYRTQKQRSLVESSMKEELIKPQKGNEQLEKIKQQLRLLYRQRQLFKNRITLDDTR